MNSNGKSVLRKPFGDYMALRGLSAKTQEGQLRAVTRLPRSNHRAPDQLSNEEIQAFLLHLIRDPVAQLTSSLYHRSEGDSR